MVPLHSGYRRTARPVRLAIATLACLAGLFAPSALTAADFDPAFNADVRRFGVARAVAVQADGKVVVGGIFSFTDGLVSAGNLARFNADGSLDTAFRTATGTGANGPIYALSVHQDGKIYLAGSFTAFNGVTRNRVARLNSDGSLDTTFDPGTGPNGIVLALAVQSDGKPVLGGQFTSVAGMARNRVARLNTNGTHDTAFNPGSGANGTIWDLTLDGSGRVVIVGEFTSVNGTTRNRIARLTTTGALDTTIAFTGGANGAVFTVEVDAAGLFYIGGGFSTWNGTTRNGLARLTTTGALDTTFATGTALGPGIGSSYLTGLKLDSQGRVLITGSFGSFDGYNGDNGFGLSGLLRLTTAGARDTTFNPAHDDYQNLAGSAPQVIAVAAGDAAYFGGYFFDTAVGRGGFTRLTAAGARDTTFNPGGGLLDQPFVDVRAGTGGKYYLLGLFDFAGGKARHGVARFLPSGLIDEGFQLFGYFSDPHFNGAVTEILELPDGKLWAFGSFTEYSGVGFQGAVRFSAGGSVEFDATANELRVTGGHVRRARLDSNGGVYLAGTFTGVSGVARSGVARVTFGAGNAANALLPDTGFNAGSGPVGGTVWDLALDSAGRLLVAGEFTSFSGTAETGLVRLSPTGALDTAFAANTALNGGVLSVEALAGDKVLIGGLFTSSGGFVANRIDRLNANGTSDTAFVPGTGANGLVRKLATDPFGNVAFVGGFTTVRDAQRLGPARVGANGSADDIFAADALDPHGSAYGLLALPDGKFLVAGALLGVNGASRPGVARFHGASVRRGELDSAQTGLALANNWVNGLQPLAGGRLLVVGSFNGFNGVGGTNRVVVLDRDGRTDPAFNFGFGADSSIHGALVEPDGKILLYGSFTTFNNASAAYLVRLNADGSRDTTFAPPSPSGEVRSVLRLPDGRYLIAGAFANLGGAPVGRIARLNANGSRDLTFSAGAGADATIHTLARAADGSIYAGGAFQNFAAAAARGLVKLAADGARDTTFDTGTGIPSGKIIHALHVQADGRLLVGGDFTTFAGASTGSLVRLATNGARDPTFMPGGAADFAVHTFLPLAQGGLAVGGSFRTLGGGARRGLAVIDTNGQVNPVFDFGTGFNHTGLSTAPVFALAQLSDGRLVAGGTFNQVNGVARNNLAYLYASFEAAPVATGSLTVVEVEPGAPITVQSGTTSTAFAYQWFKDGVRLAGATSPTYSIASPGLGDAGVYTTRISNGAGETFTPGTQIIVRLTPVLTAAPVAQAVGYGSGATFSVSVAGPGPFTYQWYRNGQPINGATAASYTVANVGPSDFGATFHVVITNPYGQTPTTPVALTFDPAAVPGSVSTAFTPHSSAGNSGSINSLGRTSDGKLYVGTNGNLVRLNADGTLDTTFTPALTGNIRAIAPMSDGRVVVAGLLEVPGFSTRGVARLNSDGSLDSTFTPAEVQFLLFTDFYIDTAEIYAVAVDSSNRVYLGGDFDLVAGTNRQNLARLTATGALDTAFAPADNASGPDQPVRALLVQGSNLIVAGDFTLYRNAAHNRLVRVNASNAIDGTFAGGSRANGAIRTLAAQSDGKLLIGGDFTLYNGTDRNRLARLDANGNLDTTFAPAGGPQGSNFVDSARVTSLAPMADGSIVAVGFWTQFGDWPSVHAVRLTSTGAIDRQWAVTPPAGSGSSTGGEIRALLGLPDGRVIVSNIFSRGLTRLEGGNFPPEPPSFLRQPTAATTAYQAGQRVELTALATGPGTMTYQWYRNGNAVAGATSPILALRSIRATDAGSYTLRATSSTTGMVESAAVNVTVQPELSGPGSIQLGWTLDPVPGIVRTATYGPNGSGGNAYYLVTSPPGAGNRAQVLKYNADGTPVAAGAFDAGTGFETVPSAQVVQTDGKFVAAGSFTEFNGTARTGLARLNVNGSLDTAYNPVIAHTSGTPSLGAIALQADGKLIIGGTFTSVGGTARSNVARLNTNGSLDTTFSPGAHNLTNISRIAINASGQVYLLGGNTSTFTTEIVRLTSAGALDTAFPRLNATSVQDISLDASGRLLVAGFFTSLGGVSGRYVARVGIDGVVDPNFGPIRSAGAGGGVQRVRAGPDGYVYLLGGFITYDGFGIARLARLDPSGKLDVNFPAPGLPQVQTSQLEMDFHEGALVLSGPGTALGPRSSVARLDRSLLAVTPPALVRSSGNRIVAEGIAINHSAEFSGSSSFTYVWRKDGVVLTGAASPQLALTAVGPVDAGTYTLTATNTAGSAQASFTLALLPSDPLAPAGGLALSTGANSSVNSATRLADGRIVLAGSFSTVDGTTSRGLARLNANGTLDTAFSAALPFSSSPSITSTHVLADGKILVTGYLPLTGQSSVAGLIRLQASGALDAVLLNDANLLGGSFFSLRSVVQPDGRIVVAGTFTSILGVNRSGLARLNANGTLDTTYATAGATVASVQFLLPDTSGRVLVAGSVSSVGGVNPRASFFRLNADGTLDSTYDARRLALPTDAYRTVDGRLFVWGANQQVTTATTSPLAEVLPDGRINPAFFYPHASGIGSIRRVGEDAHGRLYVVTDSRVLRLLPGGGVDRSIPVTSGSGIFRVGDSLLYASSSPQPTINGVFGFAGVTYLNPGPLDAFATASSPPATVALGEGRGLELRGDFRSSAAATLQWFKDGQPIANATSRVLLLDAVTTADAGSYTLVATLDGQQRTTAASVVTVAPATGRAGEVDAAWGRGLVVSNFNASFTDSAGNTYILGPANLVGAPQRPLQALDPLGQLRTDFTVSSRLGGNPTAMLELPGGKFLLYGGSMTLDGSGVSLVRLNADGSIDAAFTPSVATYFGSTQPVQDIVRLADGRLLVTGTFNVFNGTSVANFARLSADGVLDTTFSLTGFSASNARLLPAPDGKWWLAGAVFDNTPVSTYRYVIRLHADGSRDTSFVGPVRPGYESINAYPGANGAFHLVIRSTGLSSGDQTLLRRVGANGAFDPSFSAPVLTRNDGQQVNLFHVAVDASGRIVVVGAFDRADGLPRGGVVRLLPSGAVDPSFSPDVRTSAVNTTPSRINFAPGRLILTGSGIQYGGFTDRSGAVALLAPEVSSGAAPVASAEAASLVLEPYTTLSLGLPVHAPATAQVQWYRNGEPLAGATAPRYRVARASAAHSGDYHAVVMTPGGQVTSPVLSVTVPPTAYSGGLSARNGAADIHGFVRHAVRQPDGRILVLSLGAFVDGRGPYHLFRLNADGSFHSGLPTVLFPLISTPSLSSSGSGPSTLAVDASGRIYLAGNFTSIDGVTRNHVARLLADGTVDTTWDPGTGPNSQVNRILPLPDGKAIIAGHFTSVSGVTRNRIARLNADGSHDANFATVTSNSTIYQLLLQPDGKVLVAGFFTSFTGTISRYLTRIDADGNIDTAFSPNNPSAGIYDIALLADGRIASVGSFNSPRVIFSDGTFDSTSLPIYGQGWVTAAGANNDLYVAYSNSATIARYPGAASADNAFNSSHTLRGSFSNNSHVGTLLPVDDELLVGGVFTTLGGKPRWGLVWLNTASGDGTPQLTTVPVSQTVTTGRGVTFTVAATSASGGLSYLWTKDGDPTVLATGTTLTLPSALPESAGTYRVAVSNSAGLVEATATLTVNPAPVSSPGLVRLDTVATSAAARAFVTAPDGTHLAVTTTQILRINPATGAPEGEYLPAAPLNGEIVGLVFDAQGRAYVYGSFRTMNGQPAPGVARFTTARTLDATFASALTDGDFIFSVAPRPSGGIYVGGSIGQGGLFTLNGRTTRHLVRLTDTGAIDTAFDPGGGTNNFVERLHLLADGRLLVGGNFSQAAGVARSGLVRFLPDGSIDPAFNNIAISTVRDFKVLPDGRLLVAHSSTSVDGLARPGVVRLSADGVVDPAFLFDRSVIETPFNLVLRADGRFNAVGWINVSGSLRYTVAQYLADGSLDPAFDSGRQFFNVLGNGTVNPGNVTALFLRPDGDLHVTGNFNRVDDGINRTNHARIHGSPLPPTILVGPQARTVDSGTDVTFTVTPGGTPDFTYEWRRNGTPINGAASATLALSAVTTAAAGDYTVEVTNALGSVTSAAATLTVNVTQQAQTITFAPLSDRQFTLEPVTLTATASSGLAVVYQVVSGPAAVDGNLLTFFGTGAVTIRATQPGNASFFAAEPIERTFTVTPDFSVWLIENFTEQELGNPALTGPNADFDGDGLSNLLEYALGLDPKVPSLGNLPAVGRTATHWTYTYTRPAARNDVTYVVESSTNLTSWSTANVTLTRIATGETETWQATVPTSAGANLFFRLRVTR